MKLTHFGHACVLVETDGARILIVASHWRSAFEREAHEAVGRAAGLGDAELAAIRDGVAPELDDEHERAAVELCRALVDGDHRRPHLAGRAARAALAHSRRARGRVRGRGTPARQERHWQE